ncbi:MAG: hypothetical protein R3C68_04710 [Myxococcota bacterium]
MMAPQSFDWRRSVVKLVLGSVLVVGTLIFGYQFGMEVRPAGTGTISVSDAARCSREGADLYFNVTLGTESYLKRLGEWEAVKDRLRTTQVFILSANTHVGAITHLRLDNNLFLYASGREYPAIGKALATTKHHNTYLAFFPRLGMDGRPLFEEQEGSFRIVIRNVGKLKSRIFTFNFPLPMFRETMQLGFTQILMLLGAVLAALLISCTPCLVGTLALGSITMGTAWSESAKQSAAEVRAAMMRKTLYFLVAIIAGYLIIASAVTSLGVQVEDLKPMETVGGLVLFGLGLWFIRDVGPVAWAQRQIRRCLPQRWRKAKTEGGESVGAGASSAMGGSLAMLCSVAGAPTLTTSIVLPVMIYAGMANLAWTFAIMAVFLVISAVPFFFIATGMGEIIYSLSTRWRRKLVFVNATLLLMLGAIMTFNSDGVANVISAPADLILGAWQWLTT